MVNEFMSTDFIRQHLSDDTRTLALQASRYPDVDMPYALSQIQGWQAARHKLPTWAATEGIIYPQRLSMEQCSSEPTARYKATILPADAPRDTITDLTGGFGVDAAILARDYRNLTFVETNPQLCQLASHNLPLLGINHAQIINDDATHIITSLPHQDLIYLDPARRDDYGRKMVEISHCTPDLTILQDSLLERCHHLLVKLSPMLDIHHIHHTLHHIHSLHVVSLQGECKEIIVHMSLNNPPQSPLIYAVNIKQTGLEIVKSTYPHAQEPTGDSHPDPTSVLYLPQSPYNSSNSLNSFDYYLYEPNASIMKAQLFDQVSEQFHVHQLHTNTHLFLSRHFVDTFPGRIFRITHIYTLGKQDTAQLRALHKANIAVRNFPMTVAQLRTRLHLADGGDTYLFAVTAAPDDRRLILQCEKAN